MIQEKHVLPQSKKKREVINLPSLNILLSRLLVGQGSQSLFIFLDGCGAPRRAGQLFTAVMSGTTISLMLTASPGEWMSIHLDDLMPPDNFTANLGQLAKMTIAEIFMTTLQGHLPTGNQPLAFYLLPAQLCRFLCVPFAPSTALSTARSSGPWRHQLWVSARLTVLTVSEVLAAVHFFSSWSASCDCRVAGYLS